MAKVLGICFTLSLLTLSFGAGTSGGGDDGQYYYYDFDTNQMFPHPPTDDEGNVTEAQDPDSLHFEAMMAGKKPDVRAKYEAKLNKPAKLKEALEADKIKTKEVLRLAEEKKAAKEAAELKKIEDFIREEAERQAAKEAKKAAKEAAEQIQIEEVLRQDAINEAEREAKKDAKKAAKEAAKEAKLTKRKRGL